MFDAARTGNSELLLAAVDAGLPVDMMNDDGTHSSPLNRTLILNSAIHPGNTLLMLASYSGRHTLVQSLLTRHANPNKLNDRNQSPLAGAVFKGEDEVVRVLVEGGADPRVGRPNAIECARMFGKEGLLSLFGAGEEEGREAPVPPSAGVGGEGQEVGGEK